jgi:hypothetical protein
MFTRTIGLGGMLRFSRADVDLEAPDNRRLTIKGGGIQAGGGLRIAF